MKTVKFEICGSNQVATIVKNVAELSYNENVKNLFTEEFEHNGIDYAISGMVDEDGNIKTASLFGFEIIDGEQTVCDITVSEVSD